MVTIAELLTSSLNIEEVQQGDNFMMVKKTQIPRDHFQMLVDNNFIKQTVKDWYVIIDPRAIPFLTTSKTKSLCSISKVA